MTDVQDAIIRAANEQGIDPATALAIAERESSFDVNNRPRGRGGKPASSASGLFQLLDSEKRKYGGASSDPYEQATAGARYLSDVKDEMTRVLKREPTGPELYAGHYWGGTRGARLVSGAIDPDTPVSDVFSARELAANPNIVRAGTAGRLTSSVLGDIDRRRAKYDGGSASGPDFAQYGAPPIVDFAQYGKDASAPDPVPLPRPGTEVDLSAFGQPGAQ